MKRILLTTFFLFSCFYAQARHIPVSSSASEPHIGHFCENCSDLYPEKTLYLVEVQQGYILFLAENSCQSLYPLGYIDGMSLYNGYFAEGFGVDPSGLTDGWMHMQTDEEGAQMIQNYRDMSPEGPSVIDHFNPLIDRGDYIDNRKWFEKNYPHWTKFAIKNFSAEILSAITNEYCPSGETEIPNPTAYTVTPYFAGPSNISEGHLTRSPSRFTNETRHGDQPQSAFSADKILGSFVYEVRNIKVKYFKADGERLFAYGAEVVISDGLGFQPHDGYGYWLLGWWWAKPTPVIRAKWRIIGFGICPCEED